MAALGAAVALYSLWVVAVGGAVSPGQLANETGTALTPLAAQAGASINVFGVLFAVLAMGMAATHVSLGLSNQVKEWLPTEIDAKSAAKQVPKPAPVNRLKGALTSFADKRSRYLIGMLPVFAIFAFGEWLMLSKRESFAGLLGFAGILTAPIVAGIFSMLMLHASRRKSDCAVNQTWRWLDHPVVIVVTCGLFLASVVVHGLLIWDEPVQRIAALLVSAVMVVFLFAIRNSAFIPRAVVELRLGAERGSRPVLNVVSPGMSRPPAVEWTRNGHANAHADVDGAVVHVEALPVREVKLWTHRLDAGGVSDGLAARASVSHPQSDRSAWIEIPNGQVILPVSGDPMRVEISLTSHMSPSEASGG